MNKNSFPKEERKYSLKNLSDFTILTKI